MMDPRIKSHSNAFSSGEAVIPIVGPAGTLEVATTCPDDPLNIVVVICHPHPLFGGTMHNKVVRLLAKTFREMRLCAVRFNFRGVGQSTGEYAQGIGETDDLLAVLRWIKEVRSEAVIWLAGFSFGAFVALRAASVWPIEQLITVAPPVGHFDMASIPVPHCPWLVIQGDRDEVIDAERVFSWITHLQPQPKLIRMEGAGHFFHGRLIDLRETLKSVLVGRLSQ